MPYLRWHISFLRVRFRSVAAQRQLASSAVACSRGLWKWIAVAQLRTCRYQHPMARSEAVALEVAMRLERWTHAA